MDIEHAEDYSTDFRLILPGFDGQTKLKEIICGTGKGKVDEEGRLAVYVPDPESEKMVDYLMGRTRVYIYPKGHKSEPTTTSQSPSDTQPATDDSWIRKCGQLELHRF